MWYLREDCLFLEGQWTMQLVAHELSVITERVSSLEFSCVDGGGLLVWDSLVLLFLLSCRRQRDVEFCNFSDELLSLSDLYGVRALLFDKASTHHKNVTV
ncbi:hypothetical protein Ark11_0169 [Candidatus Ichthyocystis hellenicum]|uniref:STAS domain-containing protein n=1 Tax=Candidatus Ichthyocystis hellenicum TaxID=1561003 RepID=A0A0S4M6K9_9BURK|nr:hypothetical protein Ark11_0169 [Candidatus Ichthyocystis hellenicum]